MKHLVDGVRAAVAGKSWYAALGLALALPDICGFLETPADGSRVRYARWFKQNLEATYTVTRRLRPPAPAGATEAVVFLTGDDCYALRCAYLHQGDMDITSQRAQQALDRFVFLVPPPGVSIHMNKFNSRLQLQVDLFCEEVAGGVESWLAAVASNGDIQARIAALPVILLPKPGEPVLI